MCFGLKNAPATFQRALDTILNKYIWKSLLVYLDDIIIFLKNNDHHLKDSEDVLSTPHDASDSIKMRTCYWFTFKVEYLGNCITPQKLSITGAHSKGLTDRESPPRNRATLLPGDVQRLPKICSQLLLRSGPIEQTAQKEEIEKSSTLHRSGSHRAQNVHQSDTIATKSLLTSGRNTELPLYGCI